MDLRSVGKYIPVYTPLQPGDSHLLIVRSAVRVSFNLCQSLSRVIMLSLVNSKTASFS